MDRGTKAPGRGSHRPDGDSEKGAVVATMNAAQLAETIVELVESYEESGADALGEPELEGVEVKTFRDAALMTTDDGVVVTLRDGSEFQVSIVQSKEPRR
jgi:hypothetical protein